MPRLPPTLTNTGLKFVFNGLIDNFVLHSKNCLRLNLIDLYDTLKETPSRAPSRNRKWRNYLMRRSSGRQTLPEFNGKTEDPYTPYIPGLAPRPSFLVVHLFSGRRREHDIHSWLDDWAVRHNIALTVLSLDTAIFPVLGNLDSRSESWARLQDLYLQGYVSATLSGHPCETFSSARWTQPPPELQHQRWPRPLRTALKLFGLDHRTLRELRQTSAGTAFFLQTIWMLACHIVFGGYLLEEHPGIPRHEHHPSIWKSSIVQIFRRHPDVRLRPS